LANSATVTHADAEITNVIDQYLHAFAGDNSILVVSTARLDLVRAQPQLAGWYVTDCTTTFEQVTPQNGAGPSTGELVIETSGTTGEPKMVRYRKDVIRHCAQTIAAHLPLDRARNYVSIVNPRLAYGMSIVHSHFLADVPVTFQPAPLSLDVWGEFRAALQPNSSVYLLPHQSFLLAQDPSWVFDGPLELIFAGGPLSQPMVDTLRPVFPNATIVNMYGQAELGPRISMGRSAIKDFDEGNVGKPLPGVKIRIAGHDSPTEKGPVEIISPYRMSCYFRVTEPDDRTRGAFDEASPWWHTGDMGFIGADGTIHVAGRDAPDINFLGSRVQLQRLRQVVRDMPDVLDARVSAVDHAVYGQQPSIRVLVKTVDATIERRVRQALSAEVGSSAAAMAIKILDVAGLPESGKL
jgi:acyl-coenzyme A synthetase/AMP-(fatty) acid ligase